MSKPNESLGLIPEPDWVGATSNGKKGEVIVRRALEDRGYEVQDANILFRANCPNIDLVVFARDRAIYLQVKTSTRPAGKDCVIVDGSAWSEEQLYGHAPIYNKHNHYRASLIVVLDTADPEQIVFYIIPPNDLEAMARERSRAFAGKPKRDGSRRSIAFRKELPRTALTRWRDAWNLFDLC